MNKLPHKAENIISAHLPEINKRLDELFLELAGEHLPYALVVVTGDRHHYATNLAPEAVERALGHLVKRARVEVAKKGRR